jgi:SH3-like domain-containing protein
MKQRINTLKEEWKKILTFGALGWVKSSQIWGKMGSTSPVTRHGSEKSSVEGRGRRSAK